MTEDNSNLDKEVKKAEEHTEDVVNDSADAIADKAATLKEKATEAFDYGYDALNSDYLPIDMSFVIEEEKYIIQGVGEFDDENLYPVTIDLSASGNIEIELTALENFDEEIDVYVYDSLLGTYSRINDTSYQVNLDAGSHTNRYFITFQDKQ